MQQAVELVVDGKTLRGMYHLPAGEGSFPTVLLFHVFGGTKLEPHRIFLKPPETGGCGDRGLAF